MTVHNSNVHNRNGENEFRRSKEENEKQKERKKKCRWHTQTFDKLKLKCFRALCKLYEFHFYKLNQMNFWGGQKGWRLAGCWRSRGWHCNENKYITRVFWECKFIHFARFIFHIKTTPGKKTTATATPTTTKPICWFERWVFYWVAYKLNDSTSKNIPLTFFVASNISKYLASLYLISFHLETLSKWYKSLRQSSLPLEKIIIFLKIFLWLIFLQFGLINSD